MRSFGQDAAVAGGAPGKRLSADRSPKQRDAMRWVGLRWPWLPLQWLSIAMSPHPFSIAL